MVRLKKLTALIFCLTALMALPGHASDADNGAAYQARLDALNKQVAKIQRSMQKRQTERGETSKALKASELEVARVAKALGRISRQSRDGKARLTALAGREQDLQAQLDTHQTQLVRQLRAAYQTSRTPRVKVMLSQEDPALVSRILAYYNAFNAARQRSIATATGLLDELSVVRSEQETVNARLQASLQELERSHADMQRVRAERKTALLAIEKSLENDAKRLKKLHLDQRELENLLEQLNAALAEIPPPPLERKPFKSMRGKLPWPTRGTLKARYNTRKGAADLRWKGMFIGAKTGTRVRAIYHGQVAFADWMNGFGLILIVDHGDGYMSIYANAESLHKSQGEWVRPGDVIATAGDSGGQKSSGVYFEMRRDGQPINPHRWVKKSIKSVSIQ